MTNQLAGPPQSERRKRQLRRITQDDAQAYKLAVYSAVRSVRRWLALRRKLQIRLAAGAPVEQGALSLHIDAGETPTEAEIQPILDELNARRAR